jgi:hypothetical protein
MTSTVTSFTGTPKVNVRKLTIVSKQEYIIEGFKYVRMKFRKKGHFVNLTEKSPNIKTTLKKRTFQKKQDI